MATSTAFRRTGTDKKGAAITIRPVAHDDAARLVAFFDSLSASSKQTFQPHPFTKSFAAKLAHDAQAHHHLRLVALTGKQPTIVGYAFITRPPLLNTVGYFGIAVSDRYQGRGISTLLIKAILAYAQQQGVTTIYLNVMAENQRAQAAYHKYGFTPIAAPLLLGKYLTLYELWYNDSLSELFNKPADDSHHQAPAIWMRYVA